MLYFEFENNYFNELKITPKPVSLRFHGQTNRVL